MEHERSRERMRDGIGNCAHVQGVGHGGVEGVAKFGLGALTGGIVVYTDNPRINGGSSRDRHRRKRGRNSLYIGARGAVAPHSEADGGTRMGLEERG